MKFKHWIEEKLGEIYKKKKWKIIRIKKALQHEVRTINHELKIKLIPHLTFNFHPRSNTILDLRNGQNEDSYYIFILVFCPVSEQLCESTSTIWALYTMGTKMYHKNLSQQGALPYKFQAWLASWSCFKLD